MFKVSYLRTYPWWLQLVLFMLMVFTMLSLSAAVLQVIMPQLTGYPIDKIVQIDKNSPRGLINASILYQLVSSIGVFLLPSLLFAYLAHPEPVQYLGLRKPGKNIQWLLVVGIMLGVMPLLVSIEGLISKINFSAEIKASQAADDRMMNALLTMPTFADFAKVFAVMAMLPAIAEELFFRGLLLRFAKKKSMNMVFPILFSAAVFAMSHSNIYGLASIFSAGVLLGVIYNLTGSLWCSMLGHMFNNGFQIVLVYLAASNSTLQKAMESNMLPPYIIAGGAVLFSLSLYGLIKNKTPLPEDWAEDFTPEELRARHRK